MKTRTVESKVRNLTEIESEKLVDNTMQPLFVDQLSAIESERPVDSIMQPLAKDHISFFKGIGTTESIPLCTSLRPSWYEGDTQLRRVWKALAGSDSGDRVCQGGVTVEILAEFERTLQASLQCARKGFIRQCIRRPKCKVRREIMRYGEEIIFWYINKKPQRHGEFG